MRSFRLIALPFATAFFLAFFVQAQQGKTEKADKLAPYFPTPESIVDRMLQLGELKAGEKMYDLGSGDGRIVIDAARKYKAVAVGVELDASLVRQSSERIKILKLTDLAHIVEGDLLKQDYSSADLLTVYLLPVATELVTPILEKQLKPGTRIVAHDFQFAQWKPAKIVDIDDDGEGRSHRLYLYRR
jgi:16S rRNA A1518/A1519 N6-dimethyltransferase RsmA/KsgA/DIM1 with predicted DNA glycosylase/AP lyase activity